MAAVIIGTTRDGFSMSAYRAHSTRNGVAFTASVLHFGRKVGTIEQDGNGGMTRYYFTDKATGDAFQTLAQTTYPDMPRTCDTDALVEDLLELAGF
jgi:hypothetical protein